MRASFEKLRDFCADACRLVTSSPLPIRFRVLGFSRKHCGMFLLAIGRIIGAPPEPTCGLDPMDSLCAVRLFPFSLKPTRALPVTFYPGSYIPLAD